VVVPRRPLARDAKVEYDVDSDWDTEEERGESIDGHDTDDNDVGDERELDYGDGWLLHDDVVVENGEEGEDVIVPRNALGGGNATTRGEVVLWAGVSFDGATCSPMPDVDANLKVQTLFSLL